MRSVLKVGVVGVGWGSITHVPAFRAADGYQMVALCGRDPARLKTAAEACGVDDVATDWQRFVERDDLELISVATSAASHVEIASAAIAAGKHVVVEKPVGVDVRAAAELVRNAEAAGVVGCTCLELRWLPERYSLWELVRSGQLGQLYHLRAHSNSPNWHPTHQPQAPWMYQRAEGGGYLRGTVSHDIDFLRALAGEIHSVCAELITTRPKIELSSGRLVEVDADDTAMLMARTESGATLSLSTCNVAANRASALLEVFGSEGSAVLSREGTKTSLRFAGAGSDAGLAKVDVAALSPSDPTAIPTRGAAQFARAMALMLEELLPAFDGLPTLAPSLADGVAVDAIVDAAYRSAETRHWVDIVPTLPLPADN